MIYKTILTFWWQNNGTLEFRSQCHIFGWYIDIILTRCFRTIAIHLRNFLKTLEGDFKIQKENKKLYLGDSQMVNFLTRKPPVFTKANHESVAEYQEAVNAYQEAVTNTITR